MRSLYLNVHPVEDTEPMESKNWHLTTFNCDPAPSTEIWLNLFTTNTGHTQNNGAVSIVNTIETAPLFCVYPV
jgi:hypothetical protein